MGCCNSTQNEVSPPHNVPDDDNQSDVEDKQLSKVDGVIGTWMQQKAVEEARVKKLLLLGTGSSGKSTLFKQLKCIYRDEAFDVTEYSESRPVIRRNLVACILTLLQKSQEFAEKDPERYGHLKLNMDDNVNMDDASHVRFINDIRLCLLFSHETFEASGGVITREEAKSIAEIEDKEDLDEEYVQNLLDERFKDGAKAALEKRQPDMNAKVMRGLGAAVMRLWQEKALQDTFDLRGVEKYSLIENMDYFFARTDIIFRRSYMPTVEDLLKVRIRTTGIVEAQYEVESRKDMFLHIFDVGGQRGERKKWINIFDNVTAVIFVAALNHYCAVLFEDEKINAMHESLKLFDEICNSKWFRTTEMILFLNKDDLFRERLREGHDLSICFNHENKEEEWGWRGDLYHGPNFLDPQDRRPDHYMAKEEGAKPKDPLVRRELAIGDEDAWFDYIYLENLAFIQQQYLALNRVPKKSVFGHVTTATNPDNIKQVFWDVQNIVIRSNLKRSGLV